MPSAIRRAITVVSIVLAGSLLATTLAVSMAVSTEDRAGAQSSAQSSAPSSEFDQYAAASPGLTEDHADLFRLYWAFFDRKPDVEGARHWVTQYDQCMTLVDITWVFGNSTEFENKYGTLSNRDYITLVYRNVMNRTPDNKGYAYWLELLDGDRLSRSEMMLYFSLGPEFRRKRPLPSDGVPNQGCTPPTPVTTTRPPIDVYFANCTEARNAGAAPMYRGDPGYRSALDRDDDGIACEVS